MGLDGQPAAAATLSTAACVSCPLDELVAPDEVEELAELVVLEVVEVVDDPPELDDAFEGELELPEDLAAVLAVELPPEVAK